MRAVASVSIAAPIADVDAPWAHPTATTRTPSARSGDALEKNANTGALMQGGQAPKPLSAREIQVVFAA